MSVTVTIPSLNGKAHLAKIMNILNVQERKGMEIIIIDSSSTDNTAQIAQNLGARVEVIPRSEFDHGDTRNRAAKLATGDILVFLTQDALPAHPDFLEKLTKPIRDGKVVATYAKQRAAPNANPLERFMREFRFPESSSVRKLEAGQTLSVRDVAFSNAAAAYKADVFWELGGFPENVILGEDVMFVSKALKAGHAIGYCAEAQVWHTHDYTPWQQFKRYFDIGACYSRAGDTLGGAQASGEGLRFAKAQFAFLTKEKAWLWFPRAVLELGAKWLGYRLGYFEDRLPLAWKKRMSLQPHFWQREAAKASTRPQPE